MKLPTLRSSLSLLKPSLARAPTKSDQRISGRRRQQRRMNVWTRNPCCAKCGRLTDFPSGFELDHIVALESGGPDTEENTQVLCVHWSMEGKKLGCHADKTAAEAAARYAP